MDNGTNWTKKNSGLPTNTNVNAISINGSGHIFAGTGDGLFRSTDNGNNWTQTGLANTWVGSLAINSDGNIFAGTSDLGVFRSTNNGNNWTKLNDGSAHYGPFAINSKGYIFAGTGNSSVFRSVATTTSINESGENIPTKFSLSQNYPNPFNPSTTIKYDLPREEMVTIKVYDMLGREVKTLVNEYKNAGSYSIEFNASNLSSGTYFYRITAGDFTEIKKLILLK